MRDSWRAEHFRGDQSLAHGRRSSPPLWPYWKEALVRIHAHGVVHRDLKPANILVTATGRPIVLKLGISWASLGDHVTRQGSSSALRTTSPGDRSTGGHRPPRGPVLPWRDAVGNFQQGGYHTLDQR